MYLALGFVERRWQQRVLSLLERERAIGEDDLTPAWPHAQHASQIGLFAAHEREVDLGQRHNL